MAKVPKFYVESSPLNFSFDWIDYIAGAGYKTFYGGATSAPTYF